MTLRVDLPDETPPRLLSILLPDLEKGGTAGLDLRLWRDESGQVWVTDRDGSGTGLFIPDWDDAVALSLFADQMQDLVIELRWENGASPAAWPECPIHRSHPLDAVVQNEVAVWECPDEPSASYPIGALA